MEFPEGSTGGRSRRGSVWAVLGVAALVVAVGGAAPAVGTTTERASLADDESEAGGNSRSPVLSADGNLVLFVSEASNLVPDDTNGVSDLFLRNRVNGTTVRVSLADDESEADGHSYEAAMTPDGQFIAFTSEASNLLSNLVPEDTNGTNDVFVRDLLNGTTERVSVSGAEVQGIGPSGAGFSVGLSDDGRFVVFPSNATNFDPAAASGTRQIFIRDRQLGTTELVSLSPVGEEGNETSQRPVISADGNFVAFESDAWNLVPGDKDPFDFFDPGYRDVFVRDLVSDTTERVSVSSSGQEGDRDSEFASISADGRFVAFGSAASNLVADDTNGWDDVFVRDRVDGTTIRVSLASDGSQGMNYSNFPFLTSDARFVVFSSGVETFVPGGETNGQFENDIFIHDLQTGATEVVSVSSAGDEANHESLVNASAVSGDGRYVAFASLADNLVLGDTPYPAGFIDVFVRDRTREFNDGAGTTGRIVSVDPDLIVLVEDAPAPDGVRVTVSGSGAGKVTLFLCGFSTLKLGAGSEVIVTCGSVTVEVVAGAAEVALAGGNILVTVPVGATATISDNGDGTFAIENDPGSTAGVAVTVGGVTTTIGAGESGATIAIDIMPGSASNPINRAKNGAIPVAILGSATFDVTSIDVRTLTFAGASEMHNLQDPATYAAHLSDVNKDGFIDLVSHYRTKGTTIERGDTQACLRAETLGGAELVGCDVVSPK